MTAGCVTQFPHTKTIKRCQKSREASDKANPPWLWVFISREHRDTFCPWLYTQCFPRCPTSTSHSGSKWNLPNLLVLLWVPPSQWVELVIQVSKLWGHSWQLPLLHRPPNLTIPANPDESTSHQMWDLELHSFLKPCCPRNEKQLLKMPLPPDAGSPPLLLQRLQD